MNIKYANLVRKTQRITSELEEMSKEIDDALSRPEHKDALKLAKMRRRTRDVVVYLKDAVQ